MNAYDQFEAESLPLFDDPGPAKHFGGSTYIPEFDQDRLNHQSRLERFWIAQGSSSSSRRSEARTLRIQAGQIMAKKSPTAEERRHWDKVAQMPCLVCGSRPVELHHVTGQATRIGRLTRRHDRVTPLCATHHRISAPGGHLESVEALSHRGFFKRFWIDLYGVAEFLWEERETE
jgi:hypothetical protein